MCIILSWSRYGHAFHGEVLEADQRGELAAEDRPVEVERFLGVTGEVEVAVQCCHP
jgi:hypothetical protein